MKYAKVAYTIPKFASLDDVDIEEDELLQGIYDEDQLIVSPEKDLSPEVLETAQNRDIRKVWIEKALTEWIPIEEALKKNREILDTREASPVKVQLLNEFDDVRSIEGLKAVVESYEDIDQDEMIYSQLVSMRQTLETLGDTERDLSDRVKDIEEQEERLRLLDTLAARNPHLDPDEFSAEVRTIVKDFMEFVSDLRSVRTNLVELIFEIESDQTPDAEDLNLDDQKQTPIGRVEETDTDSGKREEPLVDAIEFARELYAPVDEVSTPGDVMELYSSVYEFVITVLDQSTIAAERFQAVRNQLDTIQDQYPDRYWILPDNPPGHDEFLKRGLSRLIIYFHVWPDEILGESSRTLITALLLCDVGMLNVPETFWLHGDSLEDFQKEEIKKHVRHSSRMLEDLDNIEDEALDIIAQHHVRGEEHGYPLDVDKNQWHTFAQKLALCDAYDALTSHRPWRERKDVSSAKGTLVRTFRKAERDLLREFTESIGRYPSGSLVTLAEELGEGIVERQTNVPKEPVVRPLEIEDETITGVGNSIDLRSTDLKIRSSSPRRISSWTVRSKVLEFMNHVQ